MRVFQIVFQSGRVKTVLADNWKKEGKIVRFQVSGLDALVLASSDLLMIDDLDEGHHSGPVPPPRTQLGKQHETTGT